MSGVVGRVASCGHLFNMRLGTFTANIIVYGKALEEYDVVSESPTKVTCWVASEEGKV